MRESNGEIKKRKRIKKLQVQISKKFHEKSILERKEGSRTLLWNVRWTGMLRRQLGTLDLHSWLLPADFSQDYPVVRKKK